jgi:hypothetical protein
MPSLVPARITLALQIKQACVCIGFFFKQVVKLVVKLVVSSKASSKASSNICFFFYCKFGPLRVPLALQIKHASADVC